MADPMMDVNAALSGINVFIALAVLYVYAQNYRGLKSKLTLGLLLFASLLLVHNLLGVYFFVTMATYYVPEVALMIFGLSFVETLALGTLMWITWR